MRCALGLLGGCLLLLCASSRIARGDERPLPEEIDRLIEAKAGKTAIVGRDANGANDDWLQLQGDAQRSGNAPHQILGDTIGLVGTVPLTDAIFTAPVVGQGRVFVVDGSGVVFAIDQETLQVVWKFKTRGGTG